MVVCIAGGRDFDDYTLLEKECDRLLNGKCTEIVSGGARGADRLGERYAKEHNIPLKIFEADWEKHGKAAGVIRNGEMASYINALIVFWDGISRGTANMVKQAKEKGIQVRIVRYV